MSDFRVNQLAESIYVVSPANIPIPVQPIYEFPTSAVRSLFNMISSRRQSAL